MSSSGLITLSLKKRLLNICDVCNSG